MVTDSARTAAIRTRICVRRVRPRSLADCAVYYENELGMASIDEAERARRWQERTTFEALEDAQRAQRWREMSMLDRSRLGLNSGYWASSLGGPDSYSRSLQYGLGGGAFTPAYGFSAGLQSAYGSYLVRHAAIVEAKLTDQSPTYAGTARAMFDDQYLVANDLAAYTRALQLDATLQEQERLQRWRERQAFEALEASEQRRRWAQMAEAQRLSLGLGSQGFASTRFGGAQPYASLYSPQSLRPMRYPLSSTLRQQYEPYLNAGANAFDPRWAQQRDWQQRAAFMDLWVSDANARELTRPAPASRTSCAPVVLPSASGRCAGSVVSPSSRCPRPSDGRRGGACARRTAPRSASARAIPSTAAAT